MHLINVVSLQLHTFFGDITPPYAVLSHRWEGEETTYDAFTSTTRQYGPGFDKIQACCKFVAEQKNWAAPFGVHWLWIDTCCIDKRSSAELSEAINSMAAWYRDAAYCVAYIKDVNLSMKNRGSHLEQFRKSEWFRRGWWVIVQTATNQTLQELLFPRHIVFCDSEWQPFGGKTNRPGFESRVPDLSQDISDIASIPLECLSSVSSILEQSVARRMSWAAHRKTSRPEDVAYCLLGLFGLALPLLYGEGSRAFMRLQEEIIARSTDESIFAWTYREIADVGIREGYAHLSLLAPDPSYFRESGDVHRMQVVQRRPYRITSGILELEADALCIEMAATRNVHHPPFDQFIIELNCCKIASDGRPGKDVKSAEPSKPAAQICMIALRQGPPGTFLRIYHAGLADDLWMYIKARFSDRTIYSAQNDGARIAGIEKKLFPINTTGVAHHNPAVLKLPAFPDAQRLKDRMHDWELSMYSE